MGVVTAADFVPERPSLRKTTLKASETAKDRRDEESKRAAQAAARRAAVPRAEGPELTTEAMMDELVQTETANAIDLQVRAAWARARMGIHSVSPLHNTLLLATWAACRWLPVILSSSAPVRAFIGR